MDTSLKNALHKVFDKQLSPSIIQKEIAPLLSGGELFSIGKDKTLIFQNDPVEYFYLLLAGKVSVVNSVSWGYERVVDYIEPLQILGLVEYLNQIPFYTAYVIAETPCTLIRLSAEKFIQIIQSDALLCYHTLVLMGETSQTNMNTSELKSMIHPRDMLGHHLFHLASEKALPFIVPSTRVHLAEDLHMNLRTLYRYLDRLHQKGYIQLEHGKIIINEACFIKMKERYQELIL